MSSTRLNLPFDVTIEEAINELGKTIIRISFSLGGQVLDFQEISISDKYLIIQKSKIPISILGSLSYPDLNSVEKMGVLSLSDAEKTNAQTPHPTLEKILNLFGLTAKNKKNNQDNEVSDQNLIDSDVEPIDPSVELEPDVYVGDDDYSITDQIDQQLEKEKHHRSVNQGTLILPEDPVVEKVVTDNKTESSRETFDGTNNPKSSNCNIVVNKLTTIYDFLIISKEMNTDPTKIFETLEIQSLLKETIRLNMRTIADLIKKPWSFFANLLTEPIANKISRNLKTFGFSLPKAKKKKQFLSKIETNEVSEKTTLDELQKYCLSYDVSYQRLTPKDVSALNNAGINTIWEAMKYSHAEITKLVNTGSVSRLSASIRRFGFSLMPIKVASNRPALDSTLLDILQIIDKIHIRPKLTKKDLASLMDLNSEHTTIEGLTETTWKQWSEIFDRSFAVRLSRTLKIFGFELKKGYGKNNVSAPNENHAQA